MRDMALMVWDAIMLVLILAGMGNEEDLDTDFWGW